MSEYIFRTEEPIEYCYGCPINNQENGRCRLGVETSGCEIPKKCHLVEVPPHGRLIDVDKLLKEHPRISSKYPSETFYENLEIFNMLSDAPTVIEASKERE